MKSERQIVYDITYMGIKYDTNEHIYETEIDIQNRLVVANREKWGKERLAV